MQKRNQKMNCHMLKNLNQINFLLGSAVKKSKRKILIEGLDYKIIGSGVVNVENSEIKYAYLIECSQ